MGSEGSLPFPTDQRRVGELVPSVRPVRSEFPPNGVNEVKMISRLIYNFYVVLLKQKFYIMILNPT